MENYRLILVIMNHHQDFKNKIILIFHQIKILLRYFILYNNSKNDFIFILQKSNEYQNQSRPYIPPRFARLKDQQKSQFYHGQQPRTIAENLIFTNNKQHQTRVDRTKSECRPKTSFRYRNIIPDYRQRNFIPIVLPSTPPLFRNNQIQFRLFNFFHPNSNRFQCF